MKNNKKAKKGLIVFISTLMLYAFLSFLMLWNDEVSYLILLLFAPFGISFLYMEYYRTDTTFRQLVCSLIVSLVETTILVLSVIIPTKIIILFTKSIYIVLIPTFFITIALFYLMVIDKNKHLKSTTEKLEKIVSKVI